MQSITRKQSFLNLGIYWIGYTFIFPLLASLVLALLPASFRENIKPLFEAIIYGITFMAIVGGSFSLFQIELKTLFRKIKLILSEVIQHQAMMYILNLICNLAIMLITGSIESNNQQQVIMQLENHLIATVFLSCIFAPLVEELVFRASIYSLLYKKRPKLCIFTASLAFGFLHVFSSVLTGDWQDCLYLLSYGAMGFCLCRCYERTQTIYGPVLLHMLNNSISIILLLMM